MKTYFLVALMALYASAEPLTSCVVTKVKDNVKYDFNFQNRDSAYGMLSATYKQDVNPTKGGIVIGSLTIKVGADQLFSKVTRRGNGVSDTKIQWGPLVKGATAASLKIAGSKMAGSIDGRSFTNSSTALVFADGNKAPILSAPPQLMTAVQAFLTLVKAPLKACASKDHRLVERGAIAMPLSTLHERALDRHQDKGHPSQTYTASSCNTCIAKGFVGVAAAEVICAATLCVFTFGLGCGGCILVAEVGYTAVVYGCDHSSACCPLACGRGGTWPFSQPPCCFGNEFCLNGVQGLCCAPGKRTCGGLSCCSDTQSCIETGGQKGTCCPDASVCGSQCCPDDNHQCVNGQCCDPADRCGNVCCRPINPSNPEQGFGMMKCVNRSKNLCCRDGQVEVGNSGICCPVGQVLKDGICCLPNANLCGGRCCYGECRNNQCVPSPTDADCKSMGFLDGPCPKVYPVFPVDKRCFNCVQGCCQRQIT